MAHASGHYYLPQPSYWPIVGSVGLAALLGGFASFLNGSDLGSTLMIVGAVLVGVMMAGWFGTVIRESEAGAYNEQVDRSYRWGMFWFIFSEVMFFGAFFGALCYTRVFSLPWLSGEGTGLITNATLWPGYDAIWPIQANGPKDIGGAYEVLGPWGIPAINTLILLSSGVTVTWAHWGLRENKRNMLIWGLVATVALGFTFLFLQAVEYGHAFHELNLTLHSGVYGSVFFMLTGFHGLHVTIGAIILSVILIRSLIGHFTPDHHFAFEAAAWYWHFVDVVWLGLFIFVYWL